MSSRTFTSIFWQFDKKIGTILETDHKKPESIEQTKETLVKILNDVSADRNGYSNFHILIHNISFFNLNLSEESIRAISMNNTVNWHRDTPQEIRQQMLALISQNKFFDAITNVLDCYFPENKIREAISSTSFSPAEKVLGSSFELTELSCKCLLNFLQSCLQQNDLAKPASKILIEIFNHMNNSTDEFIKQIFDRCQKHFKCLFSIHFLLNGKTNESKKLLLAVN